MFFIRPLYISINSSFFCGKCWYCTLKFHLFVFSLKCEVKEFPGIVIAEEPEWKNCIEGSTAVVNLAGTSISTRWSYEVLGRLPFLVSICLSYLLYISSVWRMISRSFMYQLFNVMLQIKKDIKQSRIRVTSKVSLIATRIHCKNLSITTNDTSKNLRNVDWSCRL